MNGLVPRLPRPSGKDSLVFKVRILGIFAYVNCVTLAGQVSGASQTNGISQLIIIMEIFPWHFSSQCVLESSVTAINLSENFGGVLLTQLPRKGIC